MLSRSLVLACALSAVVTAGSCKLNPLYCDDDRGCHGGQSCDTQAHQCKAVVGGDGSVGDGGGDMAGGCNCPATAPICVPPACFGCQTQVDPEATCSALSTAAPHCLTTGTGAGACVACRDARDCMDPGLAICDGTSHQCRACTADSDCASLVCDLTSPAPARGRCVDPGQVAYVDMSKDEGTGLTPDSTVKTIPEGITVAASNGRGYVRVAATGTYTANIILDANRKLFLVGAPGTFIRPAGGTAIDVNSGGQLTLRGFIVSSSNDGINCSGSTSKLTAYRTQIINNSGNGINTNNCPVVLDGVWLDSNGAAGVVVSTDFDIRNSIITRNKAMGGLREAGAPGTALFVNNTVADNVGPYGVDCTMGSGYTIKNSILYNNQTSGGKGAISETTCAVIATAADITGNGVVVNLMTMAPGFKIMTSGADAYHLTPTSPCRDKGTNDGAPDHDYDGEPRLTSATGVVDIGADEVQ